MSNAFVSLQTVSHQTPLSMRYSREEHWSGLPFPSPRDLLDSGIEPTSPALADGVFTTEPPWKYVCNTHMQKYEFERRDSKIQIEFIVSFFMPLRIFFNFLREFHCTSDTDEFKFKGLCDLASAQLFELLY